MFNEKKTEKIDGKEYEVFQMPKYKESKQKAIELIESGKYNLEESDFWILMNTSKSGKMLYSGLIISHNGCLKINQALPPEQRVKPSCISQNDKGYKDSLVFIYCNDEQGIYEVGEASPSNCKNAYPYAMAFKRLFDRVVLKITGIAYAGIYSEVEADEFAKKDDGFQSITPETFQDAENIGCDLTKWARHCGYTSVSEMSDAEAREGIKAKKDYLASIEKNAKATAKAKEVTDDGNESKTA